MSWLLLVASLLSSSVYSQERKTQEEALQHLQWVHSHYKLKHGDFANDFPEQLVTAMFLPSDAKVLELGSNLGNNSCIIASILSDSRNLVTLETRQEAIPYLRDNRNANHLKFQIEWAALSKQPLIQKGWVTKPSDTVLPGYFRVNTISFDELQRKHNIVFDTLVVDAEGALYQILQDDPDILTNIKLIILENDFNNARECFATLDLFRKYGFSLVYNEGPGYYGDNAFNQVWSKECQ